MALRRDCFARFVTAHEVAGAEDWQGIKPRSFCVSYGPAKAVPLLQSLLSLSHSRVCLPLGRFIQRANVRLSIFLILLFAIKLPLSAQEPDKPLRLDVKLVTLFVNVTDKNGAIVGGLTEDDFKVTEDGRPQKISVFERQSEMPLNLALAIDTSSSTFKDRGIEQEAAKKFVRALIRHQDQMEVLEFATDVRQLTNGFTNNIAQIDHGLASMRGAGGTALYDAIYLGSKELGRREGRKVLVLVSDGGDTVKDTTYEEAREQALRNEAMIYSIIDVPIEASAGRDLGGEHAMITLSEDTGGKYFYAFEGGLDKAFQRVSDDLRTQYMIGYYPRNQAPGRKFHQVEITIPRAAPDEFNVRHKTGYYADAQKSGD
jgi:Ca-activated chloride channel family protein